MSSVSVIVATYGDKIHWDRVAENALASIGRQTRPPDRIIRIHGDSLAQARNEGAKQSDSEWLIFLDADDELDPRYIESMFEVNGEIRRPATLGVVNGNEDAFPVMIPRRNLLEVNFIVIGAMIPRQKFLDVGGFEELPIYEDWQCWIKLWLEGCEIIDCPEAIYRVTVRPESRNNDHDLGIKIYNKVRNQMIPLAKLKGLI